MTKRRNILPWLSLKMRETRLRQRENDDTMTTTVSVVEAVGKEERTFVGPWGYYLNRKLTLLGNH